MYVRPNAMHDDRGRLDHPGSPFRYAHYTNLSTRAVARTFIHGNAIALKVCTPVITSATARLAVARR